MDSLTIIVSQLLAVLFALFYYFNRRYNYWSARGVSGPRPLFGLGNLGTLFWRGQTRVELEWARKYGKFYGVYTGFRPILTIADADLVKQVLVKDFRFFVNRHIDEVNHEALSTNLFFSEDETWRRIRAIVSPSFTSGKLKGMAGLMVDSVDKLAKHFNQIIATTGGRMNAKEVLMAFTLEVIGSTSFAMETNAIEDCRNPASNVFLSNGIKLFEFSQLRMAALTAFPTAIMKLFNFGMGNDRSAGRFFMSLSKEVVDKRRADNAAGHKRNDLVQLLIDAFVYEDELKGEVNYEQFTASAGIETDSASKATSGNGSNKKTLSEAEILAQCMLFMAAGFETTATTLTNILYYLALNPPIQDRLQAELEQSLAGTDENSEAYFETVMGGIPYLEAVIKETLRLVPTLTRLQRRVNVDSYVLNGVSLEKETHIEVGHYQIHHNPEYYPEPERFNPDRFLPENKHLLVPYTYLPFGAGPRNCIGMRFAYQEMRLCLAKILRFYKFSTTELTKIPMEYNKVGIVTAKEFHLKVETR